MIRKILKKVYRVVFPNYSYLDAIRERVNCRRLLHDKDYRQLRDEAIRSAPDIEEIVPFVDMAAASTWWPREFYDAMINDKVELIKQNWTEADPATPIVVCAVKNDLHKIKIQVQHFRTLGIKNIVYIDNGSEDGGVIGLVSKMM